MTASSALFFSRRVPHLEPDDQTELDRLSRLSSSSGRGYFAVMVDALVS